MTGSYPSRPPSPHPAWGKAPSKGIEERSVEAGSCQLCSHRDEPGGKRCAVVQIPALKSQASSLLPLLRDLGSCS